MSMIRLIDRIDFLHRHIELKSQFDQVPPRVMHLPAWNQHGAIAFSCGSTNLIGDAAHRADLPVWFNGSGQGNAPLNVLPLNMAMNPTAIAAPALGPSLPVGR